MSSANEFGSRFRMMTFGESHGPALGVVIDGCPAGIPFDQDLLLKNMARRRPGSHSGHVVSGREEPDTPEILSGIFEEKTLGTPIAMIVRNEDARSQDYQNIKPRTGHADDTWQIKFGHRDHRGGGRSSGRETVARVMAGSVAEMYLKSQYADLKVIGYACQIGDFALIEEERAAASGQDIEKFQARFPSESQQEALKEALLKAQKEGQSFGGTLELRIQGVPPGLGQPVFHKLKADLASAIMSVGAVVSVELGEQGSARGTEFHAGDSRVYGGIRGGISDGEEIILRARVKPTSSILDVAKKGRHDPCIVTRAIPVVEAMTWLVLADHNLWAKTDRI